MTVRRTRRWLEATSIISVAVAIPAVAGDVEPIADGSIAKVLAEMPEDVRVFNDHLVTLASPFMAGRLPGSRGMEIAKEYMEHYLKEAGLQAPFDVVETDADGNEKVTPNASYRQPFELGGTQEVTQAEFTVEGDDDMKFVAGTDFAVTSMGGSGEVTAPITFVGYSLNSGPNDYASYSENDDLAGRVALMFRFEPMNDEGKSLWGDGRWTARAGFTTKVRAAIDRNAAAIIIVNTPGADDPRIGSLEARGGRGSRDVPVLLMSPDAASRLIGAGEGGKPTLLQLRRLADLGRIVVDFDKTVTIKAKLERKTIRAENVGGLLPGKGDLADEIVVVGAHLDHLGMGYFGSRSGGGKLHPGADDNASGAAGILIFADQLVKSYAALPDDARARSVLFMGFSGEESGLNGSRHYVENPIRDLAKHDMMVNFDMIGRIENGRLSVSGANTAVGMTEWIQPFFDDSGLEVVVPRGAAGGSDHLPFQRKKVPALFGIIADFHTDFHTPEDTSDKINRVGAVQTIRMFHDIVLAASQRSDRWVFEAPPSRRSRGDAGGGGGAGGGEGGAGGAGGGAGGIGAIKVRFGVVPEYNSDEAGIAISDVTEGGSAGTAGVQPGDRLVRWDGKKIEGVREWMGMLAAHAPGDVVKIGVIRDGEEITLEVKLQAR